MSKYGLDVTSRKRNNNMAKYLSEASVLSFKEQAILEEAEKAKARDATFIPNMKSRRSTTVMADKQKATTDAVKAATAMIVTRIVTESMPMDLSHLPFNELLEQVEAVKTDVFGDIIDSTLFENVVRLNDVRLKTADPKVLAEYINTRDVDTSPQELLKKIIAVNAMESFKSGENTKNASVYNNISIVAKNSEPINPDQLQQLSSFIDNTNANIIGVFSKNIQEKCRVAISKDMRDNVVTEEELHDGLSESVSSIRKTKDRRKFKASSVSKELFKTVSVLQESHGATSKDYLNESFFQMCILETYKMFGCVTLNDEDIAHNLRNKRVKFSS